MAGGAGEGREREDANATDAPTGMSADAADGAGDLACEMIPEGADISDAPTDVAAGSDADVARACVDVVTVAGIASGALHAGTAGTDALPPSAPTALSAWSVDRTARGTDALRMLTPRASPASHAAGEPWLRVEPPLGLPL